MAISPPGIAAEGVMLSTRGVESLTNPVCPAGNYQGYASGLQPQNSEEPEPECSISACDPVISHDAQAAGQKLRAERRKRLPDIANATKYKSHHQILPGHQARSDSRR